MDGQDHKKPITPAVHEVHGVHLCNRCGWPFPNPHPSAKHRRAHKRVCGKVEGYKMSPSDLAIYDDEHASDEDEQHTPSPTIEKSNVKESNSDAGVRLRSNKSEDDVFSDAVTDFSESGISPSLEERLEGIKGDDKKIEQKSVEGDINVNLLKKVDECADITEKLNDPISSDQMCTGAEAVSVKPGNHLQLDDTKYDCPKSLPIQVEGDKLASVSFNSKEEKASDPALMAVERKEEPHDKLDGSTHVSDTTNFTAVENKPEMEDVELPLAGKSDKFVPRETSGDDVESSKEKCSVTTVSIPVFHNSSAPEDDSTTRVREENANHHDEKANCELPVAGIGSGKGVAMEEQVILDSSKPPVSSTDPLPSGEVDVDPRQLESLSKTDCGLPEFKDADFMRSRQGFEAGNITGLDIRLNLDVPDVRVKSTAVADVVGESNHDGDVVFSEKTKEQLISKPSNNPFSDSTTRVLEENANHHDEKANCELPVAGIGSGKGVAMEEQVILDSSKPPVSSTDPLPSGEVDVDPRQLESLSKTDCGLLEFKDADFMRSRQGFEAGNITGLDIRLNLDVPDVRVKSTAVADVVGESNHDGDVVFSEKTNEQLISKPSNNPFSDSAENHATINSLTIDVLKTPESINVHEDTEQKHDSGAVILPENSDSSPLKVQETPSVKEKCLLETDSNKSHATEDFSMPVSVGIVETPDKISHEDSSNADKKVSDGEKATLFDSKSSQDEGYTNDKLINEKDNVSAADSLEGKWGSISAVETNSPSSPISETNMQNSELRNIKGHQSKSDDFEPPSFMTLVQPGKTPDSVAASTASEIEPVQFNQQKKSESLQAGWFPSLTNVVNDSQGRKKNEEIIAKVTNWNAGKEHHSQLKNLLNEAKFPNTKQQKDETSQIDNGADGMTVSSVVEPEEPKLEIPHKEDWNSPARYPTVIKKEKKKGKPYWVPFACCSSVNRDL